MEKRLYAIYGHQLPTEIYQYYSDSNPLKCAKTVYWEHVGRFLNFLHEVLLNKDHSYFVGRIKTENYFFLCKMCVDKSFDICDIIDIRNDSACKYNKTIATNIAHNVMPAYVVSLDQAIRPEDYCSYKRVPQYPEFPVNPYTRTEIPSCYYNPIQIRAPFNDQSKSRSVINPVNMFKSRVDGKDKPEDVLAITKDGTDGIPTSIYNCYNPSDTYDKDKPFGPVKL